jgi:hypothetical protein
MIVYLNCYPIHTGEEFFFWVYNEFPFIILCYVPQNCKYIISCFMLNVSVISTGTGKAQPADVGLNRVIKHQLKQSQMQFLVKTYQDQIATGLTPDQVKFSTSLPILHDATVAGVVDVYDFMTSAAGHELVKKIHLISQIYGMRTDSWTARLGRDVPQKFGTSLGSASQVRRLKLPSMSTSVLILNSEMKSRKGPALSTLKNSGHLKVLNSCPIPQWKRFAKHIS